LTNNDNIFLYNLRSCKEKRDEKEEEQKLRLLHACSSTCDGVI